MKRLILVFTTMAMTACSVGRDGIHIGYDSQRLLNERVLIENGFVPANAQKIRN